MMNADVWVKMLFLLLGMMIGGLAASVAPRITGLFVFAFLAWILIGIVFGLAGILR